jgi:hypothetical protein
MNSSTHLVPKLSEESDARIGLQASMTMVGLRYEKWYPGIHQSAAGTMSLESSRTRGSLRWRPGQHFTHDGTSPFR